MSSTSNPPAPLSSDLQEIRELLLKVMEQGQQQGMQGHAISAVERAKVILQAETDLEALIQSRERAAQIAILRKVESLGDPVLQEKHLDELIATLSNNEGEK